MAYAVTKNPDGDVSLGSLNGEMVTLQPSTSDYATNGYALVDATQVVNNPSLAANTDMSRILTAIPMGGQGGYNPKWNPVTKKVQMYQSSGAAGPEVEVAAGVDLSALSFQLLLIGL